MKHLLALIFAWMAAFGVLAQEGLELAGEEGPDPAAIEAAVEAVLGRAIEQFDPSPDDATTMDDPEVDPEALRLMLLPLSLDSLEDELEAWRLLVEARTREHSQARIQLIVLNQADEEIEARGKEVRSEGPVPDLATDAATGVQDTSAGTATEGASARMRPVSEEGVGESAAAAPAKGDEQAGPSTESERIDKARHELIDLTAELRAARVAAVDRMQVVLKAYEGKGGDPEVVEEYSNYANVVSEVAIDVSDSETALKSLETWVTSDQGGIRLLKNIGLLLAAVFGSVVIGSLASRLVYSALKKTGVTTVLLRRFLRVWIRRIAVVVGVLWGLSLIGISIVPLLAALGAAGFILAFALQNSLSNFASGMLIMFQKPFDAGDAVEAAGITGIVERVTLFCTYLSTAENKQVIVPNNMIWEDVIVNATGTATRRLAIEFEVDTDHVLEEVEQKLLDIMQAHPDVLRDPPPEVQLASIGADSMHLVCWPWVPTEKRDQVRWELVASVGKELKILRGSTKAG